jgi:hypothetical protein
MNWPFGGFKMFFQAKIVAANGAGGLVDVKQRRRDRGTTVPQNRPKNAMGWISKRKIDGVGTSKGVGFESVVPENKKRSGPVYSRGGSV